MIHIPLCRPEFELHQVRLTSRVLNKYLSLEPTGYFSVFTEMELSFRPPIGFSVTYTYQQNTLKSGMVDSNVTCTSKYVLSRKYVTI